MIERFEAFNLSFYDWINDERTIGIDKKKIKCFIMTLEMMI